VEGLNPSNERLFTLVNDACRKILKVGVVNWQKEQDIEIEAMLLLPQQNFEARQEHLVEYIKYGLQNYVNHLKQQGEMAKAAVVSGGAPSA
jgi:hypothetical protein